MQCECLYFKPTTDDSCVAIKIQTYVKSDDIRYCVIEGQEYTASHVIKTAQHLLELSIIEFDHLTAAEQIELGLIKNASEYVPKKAGVAQLWCESSMRLESRKCQHSCCECHMRTIIHREESNKKEGQRDRRSRFELSKLAYVNGLKAQGCSSCGCKHDNFFRYYDMDHLGGKLDGISGMIRNSAVTMEMLVAECLKCRVLCKSCHIIWTRKQIAFLVKLRAEKRDADEEFMRNIDSFIARLEAEVAD